MNFKNRNRIGGNNLTVQNIHKNNITVIVIKTFMITGIILEL